MQRPALLLAALILAGPDSAQGQDQIVVGARSELTLAEVARTVLPGGRFSEVQLEVGLQDGAGQLPLPRQRLQLAWEGPRPGTLEMVTGADGRTLLTLPGLLPGRYLVSARFAGDRLRRAAEATLALDLSRRGVRLEVSVPARAPLLSRLPIVVELWDDQRALPGPVTLEVAGRPVALAFADGHGAADVPLDPRLLPGVHGGARVPVTARFAGDSFSDAATARRQVLVTTRARPVLDPPAREEAAQGSTLRLSGRVTDEEGVLSGEPVHIELEDGTVLGRGLTDADGRFAIAVHRLPLPLGPATLVAVAAPGRSHRLPGRSDPIRLTVLPPEPVSILYYAAPVLLSALALLCAFAWKRRRGLYLALLRMWRSLSPRPDAPSGPVLQPGVTLPQRSRVQALLSRRVVDHGVDGQVSDAAFGGPVAAALTAWPEEGAAGPVPAQADAAGRFAFADLPAGRWRIDVTAPGYLPVRFAATLPHRGELRGVRVALSPIRAEILAHWRRVALPLLEQAEQIKVRTPREVLSQARARGGPPFAALTALLEEAYYSPRVCTEAMLAQAAGLAGQVGRGVSPSPPPPAAAAPPG
jgi:hypothetical protein